MAKSLGALGAIAQYDSESSIEESDHDMECSTMEEFIRQVILNSALKESVRRVEYARSINYRNHEVIDIDETSSSSADESSADSDSTDSDDYLSIQNKEGNQVKKRKPPPKVKGELLLSDLPPIEDLHITVPEYECIKIGAVSSIVEEMVVVQAEPNSPALDLETVLFLEQGKRSLGRVFDVMGPVMNPFYCVRFNSRDQIQERNVTKGSPVYYAPRTEHTSFVFLAELMKLRGSDASWEHDNEPPACHLDYSDDETERKSRSYVPPTNQARSNNAFYRRERRYQPRNYGPIQWNSVHTQHMK